MDLSNFNLLKEDDDNYEIGHPSGRKLKVSKSGLSQKAHEVIKKFACGGMAYADGGEVDPNLIPYTAPGDQQSPTMYAAPEAVAQLPGGQDQLQDRAPASESVPATAQAVALAAEDSQSPQKFLPVGQPNVDPNGPPPMSGFDQEIAGQRQLARAQGNLGKEESSDIGANLGAIDKLPSAIDLVNANKANDLKFQNDLESKKVDPMHYINNMSTGNKIMTSLALILGGPGEGFGIKNGAAEMLENNINRDIDAQKNSQEKSMNLWKMNREALGTDLRANIATKDQMYTALQYRLKQAAANSANPVAQANAQIAIGQLQRQKDQLAFQNSFLQGPSQETAGGAGAGTEQAYTNHLNMLKRGEQLGFVKPEIVKDVQDRIFPGIGVATISPTPENRSAMTNYDAIKKDLAQALAFQTSGAGAGIGAWSPAHRQQAYIIQQNLVNHLNQLGDIKRLSPETVDRYSKMATNPGSFDLFNKSAEGFKQLTKEIDGLQKTEAQHLGITPFKKAPQDNTAIAWAQNPENRNDPRAIQILKQNGIQ